MATPAILAGDLRHSFGGVALDGRFSWISAFVGLMVRDPETARSAGFIWVCPLTFASSAFVPASSMPGVVRSFAEIKPVTLVVDAARALTIGEGDALSPAASPG